MANEGMTTEYFDQRRESRADVGLLDPGPSPGMVVLHHTPRPGRWGYRARARVATERSRNLGAARRRIAAEVLRRSPQGKWPDRPDSDQEGDLVLESIGFRVALADLYARTSVQGLHGGAER